MYIFTVIIAGIILFFLMIDAGKTAVGLRKGSVMFLNILPDFCTIIVLASLVLYFLPESAIREYLGNKNGFSGVMMSSLIGSVALLPGFIAYPLSNLLIQNGASVAVVASFITTLMMVGIVTLPVEFHFFGRKMGLLRNGFSFVGAIIVALCIGVCYAWLP